jgi:hypothetical protein
MWLKRCGTVVDGLRVKVGGLGQLIKSKRKRAKGKNYYLRATEEGDGLLA